MWPPSHDVPTDGGWEVLRRGGINGIFIVIMCLSWWAPLALSAAQQAVFAEARDDVIWVAERLLESLSNTECEEELLEHTTPSKRPAAESEDATAAKRQRT